jgi:hypothetical protein
MEFIVGIREVVIKDFFKGIKDMDMGKCFGLMEIFIGDGGKMEFSMVRVSYLSLWRAL